MVIILVRLATSLFESSLKPTYFLFAESYRHQLVVATSTFKQSGTEVVKGESGDIHLFHSSFFDLRHRSVSPEVGTGCRWFGYVHKRSHVVTATFVEVLLSGCKSKIDLFRRVKIIVFVDVDIRLAAIGRSL